MAKIEETMNLLAALEHSGRENKVLHQNNHENGLTFWGIYESENPHWKGWGAVKSCMALYPDIKTCSKVLFQTGWVYGLVIDFYKKEFWDKAKLDLITSQKKADEIFIFGVNVGMKTAIMKAQKLVGAGKDGFAGNETVRMLNEFDEHEFDVTFDDIEKDYYDAIIKSKPYLVENKAGWYNRADAV